MTDSDVAGEVLAYALTKPGAWQDQPWEHDLVAKVATKIFCFASPGGETVGLKCGRGREEANELVDRFPADVTVMAYIGRHGWNSIKVGGAVDLDELLELVDASYDDVVARLPKSKRPTA